MEAAAGRRISLPSRTVDALVSSAATPCFPPVAPLRLPRAPRSASPPRAFCTRPGPPLGGSWEETEGRKQGTQRGKHPQSLRMITRSCRWRRIKDAAGSAPYIREVRDLDEPLEELHFSGSVEKLREAAEEKGAKVKSKCHLFSRPTPTTYFINKSRKRSRCPRRTSGAMPADERTEARSGKRRLDWRRPACPNTHGCEA